MKAPYATKIMLPGYRNFLKDDLNRVRALDTASTAKEKVLQTLELPKQDNGCMRWGPDFTTI